MIFLMRFRYSGFTRFFSNVHTYFTREKANDLPVKFAHRFLCYGSSYKTKLTIFSLMKRYGVSTKNATYKLLFTLGFSRSFFGLFKKKDAEIEDIGPFILEARRAEMELKFSEAEKHYHDALKLSDDLFRKQEIDEIKNITNKTFIYDALANMSLSQGQFEKAEQLFKETMKGCLQLGMDKEDNAMIEISIKLASIYSILKRNDDARLGFQFCIEALNKKVGDNFDVDHNSSGLLGMALETYARFLIFHDELDGAEPMLTRAFQVAKVLLGPDHSQTLTLMNDIATLKTMKQNYPDAEKILKEAVILGEKVDSDQLPSLYCNIGALYLRMMQLPEAEGACQKGLNVSLKLKDKYGIHYAQTCLKKLKEVKDSELKK
ncbi:hypothetical protein CHS0354_010438 [Potamilus streckersoni]|uniref:Uncharacterized protein n=1 Tax=Potamilus streckersoni TaxID=2493646 RepID=A0AAE0SRV5_9BIVA|nr:hypothetical protein CHS0354_010438 [Potamilus streckersoni]